MRYYLLQICQKILEKTKSFINMTKQGISYIDPDTLTDPDMQAELERCRVRGVPRPESLAIRAHAPATFWSFAKTWQSVFHESVCDHTIKELCRVYVSRFVKHVSNAM